jgi:hypothetical protein
VGRHRRPSRYAPDRGHVTQLVRWRRAPDVPCRAVDGNTWTMSTAAARRWLRLFFLLLSFSSGVLVVARSCGRHVQLGARGCNARRPLSTVRFSLEMRAGLRRRRGTCGVSFPVPCCWCARLSFVGNAVVVR